MRPALLLAAMLALVVGAYIFGLWRGDRLADQRWTAKIEKDRAAAATKAREIEQMWQGVVNGTVRNHQAREARIRRDLDSALDGLRNRPERPAGMPAAAKPASACCTGAELCREDAAFLSREAARAEGLRGAVGDAYEVIDTTSQRSHR